MVDDGSGGNDVTDNFDKTRGAYAFDEKLLDFLTEELDTLYVEVGRASSKILFIVLIGCRI